MFTGLISDIGVILQRAEINNGIRFQIACSYDLSAIADGASIACSGPCLTVVETGRVVDAGWFQVDVSPETLDRTTAGQWQPGDRLNLERSLKMGDELGGHLVTGHVDGVATVLKRQDAGDYVAFAFSLPDELAPLVAEKGSVSLNGTSLTVNAAGPDRFDVMLIPHTQAVTTWGETAVGDAVNIEVDLMARYAARLTDMRRSPLAAPIGDPP